jgi:hypothetical protein
MEFFLCSSQINACQYGSDEEELNNPTQATAVNPSAGYRASSSVNFALLKDTKTIFNDTKSWWMLPRKS